MLESDPGGCAPIVKVIDYGIAKVLNPEAERGAEQTQTGFIGTPAFASPEQFAPLEQMKIDTRSDIYSLGVTFWYLLSGRVPFVGRTLDEIRRGQAEPLHVEQLKGLDVPAGIFSLLKSMLAPRHGHAAPVVHGLQVFAFTAPGATLFPQYIGDVFLTFTSASCRFLKEVHAGDTLYPATGNH